ncbi:hypothetical protein H5410_058187 [Solanum commersonii]|uniref:Uncharacterized protein n=1 Tax=Solanum commersonii TaxID=4109 RepID=A0A9J5WRX8_SOLCO|nr:hypothetical protein H5410_058187 [Solanum commersonii]
MEEIIFTKIYHGGILSEIAVPTYVGNCAYTRILLRTTFHFGTTDYTKESGGRINLGEAADLSGEADIPLKEKQKVRYDEDCEVSIFELGMVFEGANRPQKAVAIML